jgi:hypothetical protein
LHCNLRWSFYFFLTKTEETKESEKGRERKENKEARFVYMYISNFIVKFFKFYDFVLAIEE